MNFNFGEVLSRAWQIIWKHKVFWIFGILAGCSRGGTSFNYSFNSGDFNQGRGPTPTLPPQAEQFFRSLAENAASVIAITIAVVCIIWLVAIFLGTVGRIGLIRGTGQVEAGGTVAFGPLLSESMPYFWRIFGLSLLVGIPFLFVIGAVVAGFLAFGVAVSQGGANEGFGFLALMPFLFCCICLLVPVGIVINLIVRQAERSIVLENNGVLPSLSRGWEIFRSNLGPIILMALILGVISLVIGLVMAIPILLVVLPATFAFVAGSVGGNEPNWSPMFLALACMCLLAPVIWLINGILMAYVESAWTLTYLRFTRPVDPAPAVLEAHA